MINYKEFKKQCVACHIGRSRQFYKNCLEGHYAYFVSCPRKCGYGEWNRDTSRLYVYNSTTEHIDCFFENVKTHRAKVFFQLWCGGKLGNVKQIVIDNYLHNGFLTRRGLLAEYSAENLERMERMSMSHFLLPDSGKVAHEARKLWRNK